MSKSKIIHQVWIQGEDALPEAYKANRAKWKAAFPDWEMILWDNAKACAKWPDYAAVQERCFHHATRCDLILARAQRDMGGLAMGTDVQPANSDNLKQWLECNDSLVVVNIAGRSASNGISYFAHPGHPFIKCVCNHQLRDKGKHLGIPNVWRSTGPGCWFECLDAHPWNLAMVTDSRAYTQFYSAGKTGCPLAFCDPGYAGSWHQK